MARVEQRRPAKVLRDGPQGTRKTYGNVPWLVGAGQLRQAQKIEGPFDYL